jgi:carboxypeptidase C (cathepsin A)
MTPLPLIRFMGTVIAVVAFVPLLAIAQESQSASDHAATRPAAEQRSGESVTTQHRMLVRGRELTYTATAGFLPVRDESGKLQAKVFYTSYMKNPIVGGRPITFAFNGGPGAASLWLHMGALGHRRVLLADEGKALPKALDLVDNEETWLTFTDLVLIDPIGSGYSRVEPSVDAAQFYGLDGDVRSIGEFIRLFVSRYQRWASPKYLAGESYGTTRAAALAKHLHREAGLDVDGLILLSSALNFQTFTFATENDVPYVCYLPTYTAIAWYHHRLDEDLQADLRKTLKQAEQWAVDKYGPALTRGDQLPQSQRDEIAASLHRFTGLSESYIRRSDLRIPSYYFAKELLRDREQVLGFLDGRVAAPALKPVDATPQHDPSMFLVVGPFVAGLQEYLARQLAFRIDERYVFLSKTANQSQRPGCP